MHRSTKLQRSLANCSSHCVILLLFLLASVLSVSAEEKQSNGGVVNKDTINGLNIASQLPGQQYALGGSKHLSKSTIAALVDKTTNSWILRVDRPHAHIGKANFHHVNLNPKFTGYRDPHTRIPAVLAEALGLTHTAASTVTEWLPVVSNVVNGARLASAVYEDVNSREAKFPKETVKTATVMAGEAAGGYAGGTLGSNIGAFVGGVIGSVPGAALGSLVGGVVGGVFGVAKGAEWTGWFFS